MRYFIRYECLGARHQAGPYDLHEVSAHENDIGGYEGVTCVHLVSEQNALTQPWEGPATNVRLALLADLDKAPKETRKRLASDLAREAEWSQRGSDFHGSWNESDRHHEERQTLAKDMRERMGILKILSQLVTHLLAL